jgi:uroporphyrinogen-III synthase
MRVLVTRPQSQGERTAQRLRGMGHEPLLLPLSEPRHDTDAAIEALNVHDGPIAITSAEAVRSLTTRSGELAHHLARPIFGVPRAETFEKRATELGLHMDVAVCYRMQPVTIDPAQIEQLARTPADAVLFYSREAALVFFELVAAESTPVWLTDAKLLCLSEAVATAVPSGLRKNIRTAAMPDEQSLLSLL